MRSYDLEERTAKFGVAIIRFCRKVPENAITRPLISQLVRSGTSIGANYAEANSASSRKDFRNKIFIAKKEAQETKHWLRMLAEYDAKISSEAQELRNEAQELTLIFGKVLSSLREKN